MFVKLTTLDLTSQEDRETCQNLINELKRGNAEITGAMAKENKALAAKSHELENKLTKQVVEGVVKLFKNPKAKHGKGPVKKAKVLPPSVQVDPTLAKVKTNHDWR